MFNYIPAKFAAGDRGHRRGGRPLARRRQERAPPARAAHPRRGRARDHRRGQGRPRLAARRRVPRHRVARARRTSSSASCRRCTTSSRSWPRSTSPRSRWRSARRCTTSWAASASTPTRQMTDGARACSRAASAARGMHGANRLGGNSLSDLIVFGKLAGDGAARRTSRELVDARPRPTTSRSSAAFRTRDRASLNRETGRRTRTCCTTSSQDDDERRRRHRAHEGRARAGHRGARRRSRSEAENVKAHGREPVQPRLARGAVDALAADHVRGGRARGADARGEPRRATPRSTSRASATSGSSTTSIVKKGADGEMEVEKRAKPPRARRISSRSRNAKIEDLEAGKVGADACK